MASQVRPQAATAHWRITNGFGYCIADPGAGHVVYVRSGSSRNANFTFTNPTRGPSGDTYYLLRINGETDCLDQRSPTAGFVYDDGCSATNHGELWAYDIIQRVFINHASVHVLYTCNDTDNSRITASANIPGGCNLVSALQYEWSRQLVG